jgi:hypothetical protein
VWKTSSVLTNPTNNTVISIHGEKYTSPTKARLRTRKVSPGIACLEANYNKVYSIKNDGPRYTFNNTGKVGLAGLLKRLIPNWKIQFPTIRLPAMSISPVLNALSSLGKLAAIGACAALFYIGMDSAKERVAQIDWNAISTALQGKKIAVESIVVETAKAVAVQENATSTQLAIPSNESDTASPVAVKTIQPPKNLPLPSPLWGKAAGVVNLPVPKSDSQKLSEPAPPKRQAEEKEEAVSVTIAPRQAPTIASASTQPPPPATATEKWIPVTVNDGQLVMRNGGAFKQISIGQDLPTGGTLKSINEDASGFTTSNGQFLIK